jgi:ABC-type multidrug transport system fused ATPase/permease subunit
MYYMKSHLPFAVSEFYLHSSSSAQTIRPSGGALGAAASAVLLDEPGWPTAGRLRFQGVSMRYRPGLDLVLRGLSFEVEAGRHVGIVGRTGAGKSSLLGVLFRLVEIEEGVIEIDGRDIRSVGLHTLREAMSIIPQVRRAELTHSCYSLKFHAIF